MNTSEKYAADLAMIWGNLLSVASFCSTIERTEIVLYRKPGFFICQTNETFKVISSLQYKASFLFLFFFYETCVCFVLYCSL